MRNIKLRAEQLAEDLRLRHDDPGVKHIIRVLTELAEEQRQNSARAAERAVVEYGDDYDSLSDEGANILREIADAAYDAALRAPEPGNERD